MNRCIVIGLLGTTLDRGEGPNRWNAWRPTVSLCQHEDLLVRRLELLVESAHQDLARLVTDDIRIVSPETEVRLHVVQFRNPWDFEEVYGVLHDFARSYPFNPEQEQYLFHVTTGTHVAQICTFLLTESRHYPGRLIQTAPPPRHRPQERGAYSIIDLDLSRYDRIAQRFADEQRQAAEFLKGGIQTRNPAFNQMIEQIEHVAVHSRAPILLTGPTGAGKSRLAQRIYELKKLRRSVTGRFVEVNCATIRGDGAMSALFGHRRGAFTGATSDRAGLLREADAGMLFLDEVGELGVEEQAMLLAAVEQKRFYPLGSDREVSSDFQLVCGTNRDLNAAMRAGTFREELLARINLWSFEMPGLALRREDIAPNVEFELAELTAATGRIHRFNREALDRFLSFAQSGESAWRRNFRDLNAAITRMATLSPSGRITVETVEGEVERLQRSWRDGGEPYGTDSAGERLRELMGSRAEGLDDFDRVQLAHVVDVCRQSPTLSAAGRRLFAVSRLRRSAANDADRLRKYLARFGLTWAQVAGWEAHASG